MLPFEFLTMILSNTFPSTDNRQIGTCMTQDPTSLSQETSARLSIVRPSTLPESTVYSGTYHTFSSTTPESHIKSYATFPYKCYLIQAPFSTSLILSPFILSHSKHFSCISTLLISRISHNTHIWSWEEFFHQQIHALLSRTSHSITYLKRT